MWPTRGPFLSLTVGMLQLLLMLVISSPVDVTGDSVPVIFYPFGREQGDSIAPVNDDGYTNAVSIDAGFTFFGSVQRSVYVNTNGDLSFRSGFGTYTPQQFPLYGVPMIAPYWADVDTLLNSGRVYYRQTTNSVLLTRATTDIRATFSTSGFESFTATWVFIATWQNVTYFGGSSSTPTNTFQCVLITNGVNSFALFNYAPLTWTTGTASGGNALTGLGGTPAQVGFNYGDSANYYAVPTSRTSNIVNIYQQSNIGISGRWIFRVDQAQIASAGCKFTPDCSLDSHTGLCAGSGLCSYQGDPHYTTCDGLRYDYMGICKYLLVGQLPGQTGNLPSFQVFGRNEYRNNVDRVSWYRDVEIVYGNDTVLLKRAERSGSIAVVTVNGVVVSLPHCMPQYTIYFSGKFVRYQADFGLAVETDGYFIVNIYVPPSYRGKITGLCGNFDGIPSNDMVIGSVDYKLQVTQFGDHFIVPDSSVDRPATCPSAPTLPLCNPLPGSLVNRCQQLTDSTGPFASCVRALDSIHPGTSTALFNNCLLDACYFNDTIICQHVFNMVEECAYRGYQIDCNLWQSVTHCPVICPAGMIFECNSNRLCMPTCDNPIVTPGCTRAQRGACVCPMGQLLFNGTCTPSCPLGCVDSQNAIHPVGDVWNRTGCTQLTCEECTNCPYGHKIVSENACGDGEYCNSMNQCARVTSPTVPSTTPATTRTTAATTTTTRSTAATTTTTPRPNAYVIYSVNGGVWTYSSSSNGLALMTTDNYLLATDFIFVTPCLSAQVPNANLSSGQCVTLQAADGSSLLAVNVMGGVVMMSTANIQTQFSCLFDVDASVFWRRSPTDLNIFALQSVGYTSFYFSSPGVNSPIVMYYNNNNEQLPSTTSYYFQLAYTGFSSVFKTCPNVWTLTNKARPATLGSLQGTYTISYCQQLCLVYPNCIGITVQNYGCAAGSYSCYFTIRGAANQSLLIDPAYVHFDLTSTFPSPCRGESVVTWTSQNVVATNITSTRIYSSTSQNTNPTNCRYQCQSNPSCLGVKWFSGLCYQYFQDSSSGVMVPAGTVVTIQVPKVNSASGSNVVNVLTNYTDPAATPQSGVVGYESCYTLCMNNVKCSGFQLLAGGACSLSMGSQATMLATSSYSYFDVQRSPSGNGCQNQWKVFSNTANVNSVPYSGTMTIQSEQDCRAACVAATVNNPTTCVGVDYNPSTNVCKISNGSQSSVILNTNPSTSAGWNHFELTLSSSC